MEFSKLDCYILAAAFLLTGGETTQCQTTIAQNATPPKTAPIFAVSFLSNLPHSGAPVEIVQVSVDGESVPINQAVAVKGDWVSKIHVIVRNVSPRTMVAGSAIIDFPETGDGTPAHPIITAGMHLGLLPVTAYRRKDGSQIPLPANFYENRYPIAIAPGKTMEFHSVVYSNGAVSGDAEQLAAYKAASISRVVIDLRNFTSPMEATG